jgi:uncharacterized protein YecT (DUF1311 family)
MVCHSSDVPAELQLGVADLDLTRDDEKLEKPYRFCDHVTSGRNSAYCVSDADLDAEEARNDAWKALKAKWTAPQQAAFEKFDAVAKKFFEKRAWNENDMSGTARITIADEAERQMAQELLDAVSGFEKGTLPAVVPLARADAALNKMYADIMARKEEWIGTIDKDRIRETQRLWLGYRDAFADFLAKRFPKRSVSDWKAWVTTVRTAQLKELLESS